MSICDAIAERKNVTFDYDGHHRVVQPAAHGPHATTGNDVLRGYQIADLARPDQSRSGICSWSRRSRTFGFWMSDSKLTLLGTRKETSTSTSTVSCSWEPLIIPNSPMNGGLSE